MNIQQYKDKENNGKIHKQWFFGRWAQLETLLHEQVHLWQQNFGNDPVNPGKPYHNKEFVEKCEHLGDFTPNLELAAIRSLRMAYLPC
jgi:hypothetical protein